MLHFVILVSELFALSGSSAALSFYFVGTQRTKLDFWDFYFERIQKKSVDHKVPHVTELQRVHLLNFASPCDFAPHKHQHHHTGQVSEHLSVQLTPQRNVRRRIVSEMCHNN